MSRLVRFLVPVARSPWARRSSPCRAGAAARTRPRPRRVRGKVTFQGEPLADGLIVFTPDPDRGATGKPARGELGADGAFQLSQAGEATIPPGGIAWPSPPRRNTPPGRSATASRFPSICRAPIVRRSSAR